MGMPAVMLTWPLPAIILTMDQACRLANRLKPTRQASVSNVDNAPQQRRKAADEQVHHQVAAVVGHSRGADEDTPDDQEAQHLLRPRQRREKDVAADDVGEVDADRGEQNEADHRARDLAQDDAQRAGECHGFAIPFGIGAYVR